MSAEHSLKASSYEKTENAMQHLSVVNKRMTESLGPVKMKHATTKTII
jgi:hypothetical protein